jgi:hypothetical protein
MDERVEEGENNTKGEERDQVPEMEDERVEGGEIKTKRGREKLLAGQRGRERTLLWEGRVDR